VELEFETIESEQMDFLNRSCAVALDLESMLLRDLGQNPFSTVSSRSGHRSDRNLASQQAAAPRVCRPPRRRAFGLSCRGRRAFLFGRSRRLMAGVGPVAALRLTGSSR